MEKTQKPQDIYVRQRYWVTAFFAFLSSVFLVGVIILPIAFALRPPTDMEQTSVKTLLIAFSVAAGVFGLPLAFTTVALFIKLFRKVMIAADDKGIYLSGTLVPYGFIPWDNIAEVKYFKPFNFSSDPFAPEYSHINIVLRSKERFLKGLNAIQRFYFRVNFKRLYCNLALCSGKGREIGEALESAFRYYTGTEIFEE